MLYIKTYLPKKTTPRPIRSIMIEGATGIHFHNDPSEADMKDYLITLHDTDWLWALNEIVMLRSEAVATYPLNRVKFILSEHGEIIWEDPESRAETKTQPTPKAWKNS